MVGQIWVNATIFFYFQPCTRQHFPPWAVVRGLCTDDGPHPGFALESGHWASRHLVTHRHSRVWNEKHDPSDVPKRAKRSLHGAVNLCKVFPWRWDLWTDYGKDVLCSCGGAGLQGLSCEFGSNNICNPHSHKQHRLLVSAVSDLDLFIAKGFDMFC